MDNEIKRKLFAEIDKTLELLNQGCEKGYHQHYRQDDRQDLWHYLVA